MKENKLFVLPVFIKTLMPTWMDFLENKFSDKSTPAVISPKVLVNAKRDKSIALKINAALQQNKDIGCFVVWWFSCLVVGICYSPVRAEYHSVGYHPTVNRATPNWPTPAPSQREGKNGEGERPTIGLRLSLDPRLRLNNRSKLHCIRLARGLKPYAPLCRPYGAEKEGKGLIIGLEPYAELCRPYRAKMTRPTHPYKTLRASLRLYPTKQFNYFVSSEPRLSISVCDEERFIFPEE